MEKKIITVKDAITRIKDDLRNNRIEADDLNILLKLKDVPDDLHEVIVLIHTYNKHSVGLMKNENEILINDITNIMEKLLEMTEQVNCDVAKSKRKLFTVNNLPYIIGGGMLVFFIIWLCYLYDPEATKYVIGIVSDTFSSMKKYILTTIMKI